MKLEEVKEDLGQVRTAFLNAFDAVAADATAGKIADPFKAAGTTPAKARESLEKRLPTLVPTFNVSDLKVRSRK